VLAGPKAKYCLPDEAEAEYLEYRLVNLNQNHSNFGHTTFYQCNYESDSLCVGMVINIIPIGTYYVHRNVIKLRIV